MSLDQNPCDLDLKKPHPIKLDGYEVIKALGEGAFGRVFIAKNRKANCFGALKRLKKAEIIKSHQVDHLKNECYILNSLSHPLIVRMEGIAQDSRYLFIAMEVVSGGELFKHLRKAGKFKKSEAAFYAAQVTLMWEYLHSKNVIYRDLKPENLLIDKQGYLKLTDLGFAKIVSTRTYTLCGTPEYLAPEVILNKGHGKAVDWWTLGVLLYEMVVGVDPFNSPDPLIMYQNIVKGTLRFPSCVDPDCKSLIKHLLDGDVTRRYGNLKNQAQDVKEHRFFFDMNWDALLDRRIIAPHVPALKNEGDTSHFSAMDEVKGEEPAKVPSANDPFLNW